MRDLDAFQTVLGKKKVNKHVRRVYTGPLVTFYIDYRVKVYKVNCMARVFFYFLHVTILCIIAIKI